MALKDYKSLCKLRQMIIVSKDKGNPQEHVANNSDRSRVYHYHIDGDVIKEGRRCDYLLWNEDKNTIYLIELKGSDLGYALEQLEQTEFVLTRRYKDIMNATKFLYRVVLNKIPTHALASNKVKRFMKLHDGNLCYKIRRIEESI